jgi:nucleoside-diphosphate-sugar epimerase
MSAVDRVVVLGSGYAGTAVARLARLRGQAVVTNVRSDERAARLRSEGFDVVQGDAAEAATAARLDARTQVVIAFPADAVVEARLTPLLDGAGAVTHLSSTGVYGDHRGVIDDRAPVPSPDQRCARLLSAEESYRRRGATVLRCPGIYGPDRGLHVRVVRGEHRIPGDGTRYLSRIHVADLAQFVLGAPSAPGETFVVGDLEPAPHIEVVRFLCDAYGVPMPPHVPLESVHATLRADRRVDASRAIAALGVRLAYPTYREGMSPSVTGLRSGA